MKGIPNFSQSLLAIIFLQSPQSADKRLTVILYNPYRFPQCFPDIIKGCFIQKAFCLRTKHCIAKHQFRTGNTFQFINQVSADNQTRHRYGFTEKSVNDRHNLDIGSFRRITPCQLFNKRTGGYTGRNQYFSSGNSIREPFGKKKFKGFLTFLFKGAEAGVLALVLAAIMFDRHLPGLIRVAKGEEKRNAQYFKKRSGKT